MASQLLVQLMEYVPGTLARNGYSRTSIFTLTYEVIGILSYEYM